MSLTLTNKIDFSEAPVIQYQDFKPQTDDGSVMIGSFADFDFGAGEWLTGPTALVNLNANDINDLDISIDVPDDTQDGSYAGRLL